MDTSKPDDITIPGGNGSVAKGIEQMGSGAHEAIDKATDAARPAVDRIASSAHQAVDKAKGAATHAAETLGEQADHLKEAQTHLVEACGKYMRTNPVASLGLAVGVGFLISRLMDSK